MENGGSDVAEKICLEDGWEDKEISSDENVDTVPACGKKCGEGVDSGIAEKIFLEDGWADNEISSDEDVEKVSARGKKCSEDVGARS